jgi:hypothetical protein
MKNAGTTKFEQWDMTPFSSSNITNLLESKDADMVFQNSAEDSCLWICKGLNIMNREN